MFLLSLGHFVSLIGSAFHFSFCGQIVGMVVMAMVAAVCVCILLSVLGMHYKQGAFLNQSLNALMICVLLRSLHV